MADRIFFSIIIPAYQCERSLRRCVESVLAQEEESYEIILTDDGSTDKSGEICDFYADMFQDKVKVIHKPNEGPLLARLDAIQAAGGQYMMFLDADDIYLPGILGRVKRAIEVCQADMVIFNHFRVSPDGNRWLYTPQYPDGTVFEGSDLTQLYADAVTGENLNALWQKCIYRGLLAKAEEFRRFGKMMIGEDKLISLKAIGNAVKVVYLADGLYEYRIMQQSVSHALSIKHYRDMSKVYLQTLEYMSKWELNDRRSLCGKNKVEFGLKCLYSVADHIRLNKKGVSEFAALARFIAADQEFWDAFDLCRKNIAPHKRIACRLLRRKLVYLTFAYLYAGIFVKRRS